MKRQKETERIGTTEKKTLEVMPTQGSLRPCSSFWVHYRGRKHRPFGPQRRGLGFVFDHVFARGLTGEVQLSAELHVSNRMDEGGKQKTKRDKI